MAIFKGIKRQSRSGTRWTWFYIVWNFGFFFVPPGFAGWEIYLLIKGRDPESRNDRLVHVLFAFTLMSTGIQIFKIIRMFTNPSFETFVRHELDPQGRNKLSTTDQFLTLLWILMSIIGPAVASGRTHWVNFIVLGVMTLCFAMSQIGIAMMMRRYLQKMADDQADQDPHTLDNYNHETAPPAYSRI